MFAKLLLLLKANRIRYKIWEKAFFHFDISNGHVLPLIVRTEWCLYSTNAKASNSYQPILEVWRSIPKLRALVASPSSKQLHMIECELCPITHQWYSPKASFPRPCCSNTSTNTPTFNHAYHSGSTCLWTM